MPAIRRARSSVLNDSDALADAIARSTSVASALRLLGLRAAGGNHARFLAACARHGLEAPVFDRAANPPAPFLRLSDEEIFREGSTYTNREAIKRRLLALGVANECAECGMGALWQGRPLALQLDHINGVPNDHRLENLRLLCPNCHSQTETFTGRRARIKCPAGCGRWIPASSGRCGGCRYWLIPPPRRAERTDWPPVDELAAEVAATSFSAVGRRLGVSDNAVRKRICTRG